MIRVQCPVCGNYDTDYEWRSEEVLVIENGPCSIKCLVGYKILYPTIKWVYYLKRVTKTLYIRILKILNIK